MSQGVYANVSRANFFNIIINRFLAIFHQVKSALVATFYLSQLRRKIQSIEINKDVSGCFFRTRAHLAHAPWQPNLILSQYLRLYDALSPARFIISSLVDKFILRFIDCEKRDQGGIGAHYGPAIFSHSSPPAALWTDQFSACGVLVLGQRDERCILRGALYCGQRHVLF
jgi:hypothetical protein